RSYAREREERRLTQRRYSRTFGLTARTLEQDIQRLCQQIWQHQLERNFLDSIPPVTPWNIVPEYYRLFLHVFKGHHPPNASPTSTMAGDAQLNFLHKVMDPVISVNSRFGVDALIAEWLTVAQVQQDIAVRLLHLDYPEENVILAKIRTYTTITDEMLRREFPCFVGRSKGLYTCRLA
ncbi:hypothetical protein PHMEG_0004621, partial [Phytophthora megakarya]